ncbi:MAG: glycosyltransferase [Candidatus Omnitrophota bacterium]|nr:glycosyltransferase [Candidatus Omnitrophota bacterium]
MNLAQRFILVNFLALMYAVASYFLAQPWIDSLSAALNNYNLSLIIIMFIAIVPGYINMLLLASLLTYKYEEVKMKREDFSPITLIIPAYNEEESIKETCRGIKLQDYPNKIEIIIVDDGSTDNTIEEVRKAKLDNLKIINGEHRGKANALNLGLNASSNEIIVTIDADTFLYKNAITRIVARIMSNLNYAAVAGNILTKNERTSRMVRIQSWDYMLGISASKRQQSFFGGTLVAQGAFSVFRKQALLEAKGWQERLGEDIVLTWALLKNGHNVGYEPTAFAFTVAPPDYFNFFKQRQRWARGMIEGLRDHLELIWKGKIYSSYFVAIDLLFPIIDSFFTFVFIPGVVLACFGKFYIAGPMTLLVLPITIGISIIMFNAQRHFMNYAGLKIRFNPIAVVFYILIYQIIMSPICVIGYVKELLSFKKKW